MVASKTPRPPGRMARDAEHDGEDIDRQEGLEAEIVPAGQQHEEDAGSGADIAGADQDLSERKAKARQFQLPALDLHGAALERHPDHVADDEDGGAQADQLVHPDMGVDEARQFVGLLIRLQARTRAMPSQKVTPAITVRLATRPGLTPFGA